MTTCFGLTDLLLLLLFLPSALQPTVGIGLSNNVLPLFPICHQLSPSSHSQHLERYLSASSFHLFLGLPLLLVPSSSWVYIFLGILSSSILSRWPNQLILCPFIHFTIFSPLLISSSSRFFNRPSSGHTPKLRIFRSNVKAVLLYGSETWEVAKHTSKWIRKTN